MTQAGEWLIMLTPIFCCIPQRFVLKKVLEGSKVEASIGKAELKISAIVVYYTLVAVMAMISFTYHITNGVFLKNITSYILCESRGQSAGCTLDLFNGEIFNGLSATSIVMVSFLPVVAILFNCDLQKLKQKRCCGQDQPASKTRSSYARSDIRSSSTHDNYAGGQSGKSQV
jgi:hypothetical protein